jgi:hypothetical protein
MPKLLTLKERLPMEYGIRTVADFLAVPRERRALCLAEFRVWLEMVELFDAALGLALVGQPAEFHWIDDDKGEMVAAILNGAGGQLNLRFQMKEGAR